MARKQGGSKRWGGLTGGSIEGTHLNRKMERGGWKGVKAGEGDQVGDWRKEQWVSHCMLSDVDEYNNSVCLKPLCKHWWEIPRHSKACSQNHMKAKRWKVKLQCLLGCTRYYLSNPNTLSLTIQDNLIKNKAVVGMNKINEHHLRQLASNGLGRSYHACLVDMDCVFFNSCLCGCCFNSCLRPSQCVWINVCAPQVACEP